MARAEEPRLTYLDTHVVCWLYEGRIELLSAAAAAAIERGRLAISPIVDLELQLLHEVGRITRGPAAILPALVKAIGLSLQEASLAQLAFEARSVAWTRDPFDRLIVAQASIARAPLVTRDRLIRQRYARAVW